MNGVRLSAPLRNLEWPSQPPPSPLEWKVWTRILQKNICSPQPHKLLNNLGPWKATHSVRWWYSPQSDRLYFGTCQDSLVQCWIPKSQRSRGRKKTFIPSQLSHVSAPVYPAICEQRGAELTFSGYAPFSTTEPRRNPVCSIEEAIAFLPDECKWALHRSEGWHHLPSIIESLDSGTFVASADGSYKNGRGTAAWRICDFRRPHICIKGVILSPGESSYQDSTRAELSGHYAIGCAIWAISKLYSLQGSIITVVCDSTSSMQKILPSTRLKCNQPHYDLGHSIKCIMRQTFLKWRLHHVEGHENRTTHFEELDLWAKMNVYCDRAAGIFRVLADRQKLVYNSLPLFHSPWKIQLEGKMILHDFSNKINEHVQKDKALTYWTNHKFAPIKLDEINWDVLPTPMTSIPKSRRPWVVKNASDWLPTNNNKFRWNMSLTQKCPFCNTTEDAYHVQTCSHPLPTAYRRKILSPLAAKLTSRHTSPHVKDVLLQGLTNIWPEVNAPSKLLFHPPWQKALEQSLHQIGWWNLIGGKWSKHWQEVQQVGFTQIRSARSSKRWQSAVIRLLWDIAWEFWNFRNNNEHAQSPTLISDKHTLLNYELQYQWNLGPPSVFEKYLYRGTFNEMTNSTMNYKEEWLKCVLVACRAVNTLTL